MQEGAGIGVEAGANLLVHLGDAARRALQARAVGVFADAFKDQADAGFNLFQIDERPSLLFSFSALYFFHTVSRCLRLSIRAIPSSPSHERRRSPPPAPQVAGHPVFRPVWRNLRTRPGNG